MWKILTQCLKIKKLIKNKVIGISGVAGSGKDLFFSLLSNFKKCRKISLAEALKVEVSEWTLKHYGIDASNCSREQKEVIRPLLVFHANLMRGQTFGRHWINILNKKIKNLKLEPDEILVITDIRFNHYEKDEVFWLKKELGGILVHISNYVKIESGNHSPPVVVHKKGANDSESLNDPKLKKSSDYEIEWEFLQKPQDQVDKILSEKYVKPFVKEYLD